jgi:hypothetical protein
MKAKEPDTLIPCTVSAGYVMLDDTKEMFDEDVVQLEILAAPMSEQGEPVIIPLYFPRELADHLGLDYSANPKIERTNNKEEDDNNGA